MKIIFFESAINFGGATIATANIAKRLSQINGYDISIVDVNGSCEPLVKTCNDENIPLSILRKSKKTSVLGSRNLLRKIFNYLLFIPSFLKTRRLLRAYIREKQPDFICVNSQRTLSYLYKNKCKSKVIFYAHAWYLPCQIPLILRFLFKSVVDKFFCVSQATKQALYSAQVTTLDKIFVVPNAINVDKISTEVANIPDSDNKTKILHAAGFTAGKNQLLSIEIAKKLKNNGVSFKMILAGLIYKNSESEQYFQKVKDKIREYDLEDEVILVVNKTNITNYFRACDMLIHPSETEGFSLVVMESMAMGKPVIANAVGGVTDQIINQFTGFLCNHNSINDYTSKITTLIENPALYKQIADRAQCLTTTCFTEDRQINSFINSLE